MKHVIMYLYEHNMRQKCNKALIIL